MIPELLKYLPDEAPDGALDLSDADLHAIKVLRRTPVYSYKTSMSVYSFGTIFPFQYYVTPFDLIHQRTPPGTLILSAQSRYLADIIEDNVLGIEKMTTQPRFNYTSTLLNDAAKYGALKCFRFLSLNGCKFDRETMASACYGGNEEIIQLCLENKCTPDSYALSSTVQGMQTKAAEWLIDVHKCKFNLDSAATAFTYSNWPILCRYLAKPDTLTTAFLHEFLDKINRSALKKEVAAFFHVLVDAGDIDIDEYLQRDLYALIGLDDLDFLEQYDLDVSCMTAVAVKTAALANCKTVLAKMKEFDRIDEVTKSNQTALGLVLEGHISVKPVKRLVQLGANINHVDEFGKTPLFYAVRQYDMVEVVQYMIDHGADVNLVDSDGCNSLICAVKNRRHELVPILLKAGVEASAVDEKGKNALHHLAKINVPKTIEHLLDSGVDINCTTSKGKTALMIAAKNSRLDTVKVLVEHGARVEDKQKNGVTALMYATRNTQWARPIFDYLVDNGADINASDFNDQTVVMYAAMHGRIPPSHVISLGATASTDSQGATLLMQLLNSPHAHPDEVQAQITGDINAADNDGKTALMRAFQNQSADICRLLIDKGADVHAVDLDGFTMLHYLAMHKKLYEDEMLDLLVSLGLDINRPCDHGNTPLIIAAIQGNDEMVGYLLDRRVDVNVKNLSGDSALIKASMNKQGSLNVIKLLVKAGAPVDSTDADGHTPLCLVPLTTDALAKTRFLVDNGANVNAMPTDEFCPLIGHVLTFMTHLGELRNVEAATGGTGNDFMTMAYLISSQLDQALDSIKYLVRKGADHTKLINRPEYMLLRILEGQGGELGKFMDSL